MPNSKEYLFVGVVANRDSGGTLCEVIRGWQPLPRYVLSIQGLIDLA